MGVLAPRMRTLDVSARPPIDTSGNFPAHVSAGSPSNISPNPSYPKFQNPRTTFEIFNNKKIKKLKTPPGGQGGSPNFFGC